MTKKEALKTFKEILLPHIKEIYEKDGIIDHPARREGWGNFVDSLQKDGQITEKQAFNWSNPF